MSNIETTRTVDPDSYDVWDAGTVHYLQNIRHSNAFVKLLPLHPEMLTDIVRKDKRWFKHINYKNMAIELNLGGAIEYQSSEEAKITTKGMVYIVTPGSTVRIVSADDRQRHKLCLLLSGSCLNSIAHALGFKSDRIIKLHEPEKVEKAMRELGEAMEKHLSPEELSKQSYALLLMLTDELNKIPDELSPAFEMLETAETGKVTVPDMAKRCGLSISTFRRKFFEHTGKSPLKYVIGKRLTNGAQLLQGSCMPIKIVALKCGFASAAKFSIAFKQHYGTAPHQYRKNPDKYSPAAFTSGDTGVTEIN